MKIGLKFHELNSGGKSIISYDHVVLWDIAHLL